MQLIERAFLLHESNKSIEQEMSPEELQELWGGLKNLVNKGYSGIKTAAKNAGNAVLDKTDKMGRAVGDAVYNSTIGAAKTAANKVATVATNVKDKVADTYNQGEVDSIVKQIYALNNKYKTITGKSFVRQYGAAAPVIPSAQKRAASQPTTAAQMAIAECVRMQHLAGLITESKS